MKRTISLLTVLLLFATIGSVTGTQINESVKLGTEKTAFHPPDWSNVVSIATEYTVQAVESGKCFYTEFRLIAGNEETRTTTKPCAPVTAISVSPQKTAYCLCGTDRLFLPLYETQFTNKDS